MLPPMIREGDVAVEAMTEDRAITGIEAEGRGLQAKEHKWPLDGKGKISPLEPPERCAALTTH